MHFLVPYFFQRGKTLSVCNRYLQNKEQSTGYGYVVENSSAPPTSENI
jgi:hypothetical protein